MACNKPLTAYKADDGSIYFKAGEILTSGGNGKPFNVPCGQCIGCRISYARDWALRCQHEAHMYSLKKLPSSFLTLTYDEKHCPKDKSLVPNDLTLFLKRLREYYSRVYNKKDIRYFACGEYGERTYRPHYHMILFGVDFSEDRKRYNPKSNKYYTSEKLNDLWKLGEKNIIAKVNFETSAYVASYIQKKHKGKYWRCKKHSNPEPCKLPCSKCNTLKEQFVVMSRGTADNRGIGYTWFKKYGQTSDCYLHDRVIVKKPNIYCKPPRYYDKLLKEDNLELYEKIKTVRAESSEYHKHTNDSHSRLAIAEKCLEIKMRRLKKDLDL